jgi:hypothetical protein
VIPTEKKSQKHIIIVKAILIIDLKILSFYAIYYSKIKKKNVFLFIVCVSIDVKEFRILLAFY